MTYITTHEFDIYIYISMTEYPKHISFCERRLKSAARGGRIVQRLGGRLPQAEHMSSLVLA